MLRYNKFDYLSRNFQLSKNVVYDLSSTISIDSVKVEVGHLKPNNTYPEHALLLAELSSQSPTASLVKHGKKLKNTIILTSTVSSVNKWAFLDKLINVIAPLISDLQAFKAKRAPKAKNIYVWRWRHFFEWSNVDSLLTDRVMRRDIYLPTFISIRLKSATNNTFYNESVLRMFRLPFLSYKGKGT